MTSEILKLLYNNRILTSFSLCSNSNNQYKIKKTFRRKKIDITNLDNWNARKDKIIDLSAYNKETILWYFEINNWKLK